MDVVSLTDHGWIKPPNSNARKQHYFENHGMSLCQRWLLVEIMQDYTEKVPQNACEACKKVYFKANMNHFAEPQRECPARR